MATTPKSTQTYIKGIKVAIDAGHGMGNVKPGQFDPGACAAGLREADIALSWALTLKAVLTAAGIECHLIRTSSTDSNPVGSRDNEAAAAGCTHYISLHCNAGPASATGVETFYRGPEDRALANAVQAACLAATGLKDRKVKTEEQTQHTRLAVLYFKAAACLVELGFITNSNDRKALVSVAVRIKFAELVRDYLLRSIQ